MFRKILMAFGLCLSFSSQASAYGPFGLGIVLAGPTGLSANYFYEKQKSLAMAVGWGSSDVQVHLDHLWYRGDLIVVDRIPIDVYMGLGLHIHTIDKRYKEDVTEIGVRVPIGVSYIFKKIPVQLFGELAPALILVEESALNIDVALGIRYYF